jgi:hypothetical protein
LFIGNRARTTDNLGYDQVRHEVRRRNHGHAVDRFAADERAVIDALGDRLRPREIKARLARRDAIVGYWSWSNRCEDPPVSGDRCC